MLGDRVKGTTGKWAVWSSRFGLVVREPVGREGVDVGEEDGEVGAESFDEVRFGGGRERGEGADQGVDIVEDLLLLEAEDFFVGETKETPVRGSVGVRVRESESESESKFGSVTRPVGLHGDGVRRKSFGLYGGAVAGDPEEDFSGRIGKGVVGESGEEGDTGDSLWVKVRAEKDLLKYVVPKGFIAVDGTSLTVVEVFDDEACFNFMLMACTQHKVVISLKKVCHKVNLEVDILGK
ncbi:hypothetical protein RJT34_23872 [Clitoria ternatea]|uniref:Lumazine-binding domain-containing protein n=1 Tax=Clitoria ternatea TaxID=43366 RepID=A0AAN9FM18_CLITE